MKNFISPTALEKKTQNGVPFFPIVQYVIGSHIYVMCMCVYYVNLFSSFFWIHDCNIFFIRKNFLRLSFTMLIVYSKPKKKMGTKFFFIDVFLNLSFFMFFYSFVYIYRYWLITTVNLSSQKNRPKIFVPQFNRKT